MQVSIMQGAAPKRALARLSSPPGRKRQRETQTHPGRDLVAIPQVPAKWAWHYRVLLERERTPGAAILCFTSTTKLMRGVF
jgi:hypothetical protein